MWNNHQKIISIRIKKKQQGHHPKKKTSCMYHSCNLFWNVCTACKCNNPKELRQQQQQSKDVEPTGREGKGVTALLDLTANLLAESQVCP